MSLHIEIFAVTPFRQNCSLLWCSDTRQAVLVDAGGDAQFLWQAVQERGLTLTALWLTHGHLDHAGGVPFVQSYVDVPVIGPHRDDEFLLQSLPETTASYGFPVCPAFTPDQWLEEGMQVTVGNHRFDVLHIPGHTPGHVVFYHPEQQLLIAGDVLFHESIGRTDFPRGNHRQLLDHIRNKLYILPDSVNVLPGHGRPTTIGHEKQYNPYVRA